MDRVVADAPESPVNDARKEILNECLTYAEESPGVFSLTVPTGGGKTLASLGFALRHMRHNACSGRIIYAIPFTSIIEQTAEQFREVFAESGVGVVLEHHCNFLPAHALEGDEDEFAHSRLASENWDAPIVVTTNVQLFESLFSASPGRCRKLHNVVGSVIILDEVQTLPVDLLKPCLAVLSELADNYECSIVLCSATQPAVERREGFSIGLPRVSEITRNPIDLQQRLRRTELRNLGKQADSSLTARMCEQTQVLCIVNTTRHAATLYRQLTAECDNVHHLSARMCPGHRSVRLAEIRALLKSGAPCRVVSTQLIEAGVDIDFPVVLRSLAGIDSIAQAAGRCNREGRRRCGEVFVFDPEHGTPRGDLLQAAEITAELIDEYSDLLGLEAIRRYFELRYWKQQDRWDRYGVMECFKAGVVLDFAFRKAARLFRLIADDTRPLIIPWGEEGRRICDQIALTPFPPSRQLSREAQRYSVSVHQAHWQYLLELGEAELHHERYAVLRNPNLYDEAVGLDYERSGIWDPEELTV